MLDSNSTIEEQEEIPKEKCAALLCCCTTKQVVDIEQNTSQILEEGEIKPEPSKSSKLLCCFSQKETEIKEFYSSDNKNTLPAQKGRSLAELSTNQSLKTRICCLVILVLLFIFGIVNVSQTMPMVQSNATKQAEMQKQTYIKEMK